jgi:hypothetical protein
MSDTESRNILQALRDVAERYRTIRADSTNELLTVLRIVDTPERAGTLLVRAWDLGHLRRWPRLGKLIDWLKNAAPYPADGSPYNEWEQSGLKPCAATIFHEVKAGILRVEQPAVFPPIERLPGVVVHQSPAHQVEIVKDLDSQIYAADAIACETVARIIEVECSPAAEISQAEFAAISGLDKSAVSRRAHRGEPMSLEAARNIKQGGKASRRKNRVESDAEVEGKFKRS